MVFNDRSADRQANSHAVFLGCVERFEQAFSRLASKADSLVLHSQAHVALFTPFGSDQQSPLSVVHGSHRLRAVLKQILNDLLELDTVASNMRQRTCKLRPKNHLVSLQVDAQQGNHFARCFVQVY